MSSLVALILGFICGAILGGIGLVLVLDSYGILEFSLMATRALQDCLATVSEGVQCNVIAVPIE